MLIQAVCGTPADQGQRNRGHNCRTSITVLQAQNHLALEQEGPPLAGARVGSFLPPAQVSDRADWFGIGESLGSGLLSAGMIDPFTILIESRNCHPRVRGLPQGADL